MESCGTEQTEKVLEDELTEEAPKNEPVFENPPPSNSKPFFKVDSFKRHSDSKLSFGPLKAFRHSLPARMRKRKPSSSAHRTDTDSSRTLAPGLDSLQRSIAKRDIPSSLAALHGTMKTELRRQVSKRVLRHKLNRLQDYSLALPEEFVALAVGAGVDGDAGAVQSKVDGKENEADERAEQQEKEVSLSLKNMSVKQTLPAEIDVDDAELFLGTAETRSVPAEVLSLKEVLQMNRDADSYMVILFCFQFV